MKNATAATNDNNSTSGCGCGSSNKWLDELVIFNMIASYLYLASFELHSCNFLISCSGAECDLTICRLRRHILLFFAVATTKLNINVQSASARSSASLLEMKKQKKCIVTTTTLVLHAFCLDWNGNEQTERVWVCWRERNNSENCNDRMRVSFSSSSSPSFSIFFIVLFRLVWKLLECGP